MIKKAFRVSVNMNDISEIKFKEGIDLEFSKTEYGVLNGISVVPEYRVKLFFLPDKNKN